MACNRLVPLLYHDYRSNVLKTVCSLAAKLQHVLVWRLGSPSWIVPKVDRRGNNGVCELWVHLLRSLLPLQLLATTYQGWFQYQYGDTPHDYDLVCNWFHVHHIDHFALQHNVCRPRLHPVHPSGSQPITPLHHSNQAYPKELQAKPNYPVPTEPGLHRVAWVRHDDARIKPDVLRIHQWPGRHSGYHSDCAVRGSAPVYELGQRLGW